MTMTDPRPGTAQAGAQPACTPSGHTDPTEGTPGPQRPDGVNPGGTWQARNPERDATQFGKFVCRILRAYARRAAAEDPWVVKDMLAARDELDRCIQEAVTAEHAAGYSWEQIGYELGMTRQGVYQRWGQS